MKLFAYLKWRTEYKAEQKRIDKKNAELERILLLRGEIKGLEKQIELYIKASYNLMFSNHTEVGNMEMEREKKIAKLNYLLEKHKPIGDNSMNEVIVTVSKGVVNVIEMPDGARVIVRDYDIEGGVADPNKIKKDQDGDKYVEMVFE